MAIPKDIRQEDWITNRITKRWADPGTTWCWACDRAITGECRKCPVCGYRDRHRVKKDKR